jgi:hypothetical protein
MDGTASAAPSVTPITSQEVQADQQASGISSVQAQANLALEHQASRVDLAGQLEEELGSDYASVWFDGETGEFVVPIATAGAPRSATEEGRRVVQNAFDSAALSGEARTEVVAFSQEELEAAQSKAGAALASFLAEGQVQTALDPKTDALVLRLPEGQSPLAQGEIESVIRTAEIAVPVEMQSLPSTAFEATGSACDEAARQCGLPVRGGEEIFQLLGPNLGEYAGDACTVAFRANGYDGQKYLLTAGHCHEGPHREEIWNWSVSGPEGNHLVGTTSQWHWPGRDWAKINATGTWADQSPWPTEVAYWGTSQEVPITGEAVPYVGETLCHSGANTGTSCGEITASNVNVHYSGPVIEANLNSMYLVKGKNLCLGPGDSGGPFFAGGTALGILSGGGPDGCQQELAAGVTEEVFFSSVVAADEELGTNIAGPGVTEVISGSPTSVGAFEATVSGQVDPHGLATEYAVEYGPGNLSQQTSYGSAGSGQGFVAVSKALTGLEPATNYQYRVTASNGFGTAYGAVGYFRTAAAAPRVTTLSAQEVKKNSAAVLGSVNPLGEPTVYQFEYGTTTAYGSVAPASAESVGAGRGVVGVGQLLSGLKEGTTYHFRIRATNAGGTSYGSDQAFTTPNKPVVTAEAASYVNTLEPTLNATINPERADTHYQFEYGTTEAYGTKVPIPAADLGAGSAALTVERGLRGLARSATYHYRVTAENEVGVIHGADRSFTTLPPCKGAEAKCVWSAQTAANPPEGSKYEMKGVGCASATSCIAVGKNLYTGTSYVDRWNGTAWSLVSGGVGGEMRDVACMSTACFVVGTSGGAPASWSAFEFMGSWAVITVGTAVPSGSSGAVLDGVSCSGEAACTAVGSYKGPEGTYHPLVERWNGSAWSLQSAPAPAEGTAQNAMLSVTCISVGCMTVGEAAGKPVAETWFGGAWALSPAPKLPAGAKGGRLSSVSCNSTTCVAVGSSNEGVGTERALAEAWSGSAWSLQSAVSPAEAKGFVELTGVSCAGPSACTATGYYAPAVTGNTPTELKTLAEAWNGTSWTIQSSPNAPGQRYNALADVSCTAAGACTTVGQDAAAAIGSEPESLAERWNGSAWSTQPLVHPEPSIEDEAKSVSCPVGTNTVCVAVGKDTFAESGFAEVWNGTAWSGFAGLGGEARKVACASVTSCFAVGSLAGGGKIWLLFRLEGAWGSQAMNTPLPAGSSESVLDGVSCAPGGATCTAVGSYKGSEGTWHPLVERWNGSAWSLQTAPDPVEGSAQNAMLGVSCPGSSTCTAVGEAAGKPVAENWNGSSWSRSAAPPLPAGAKGGTLAALSCGSTKACMAVGDSYEGAGSEKALVERWNGSAWSIVAAPAPGGAKGPVQLTDVSCLAPNACFSAGTYVPEVSGGIPTSSRSLVESWEGTEWTVLTSPNVAGQTYDWLGGISCSTSIDCTAVGGASSSLNRRPPVQLVARYE